MKIVATADLHLGAGITAEMRSNRFVVFHRILKIAREEGAKIILISGDFLEQDRISSTEVKGIIKALSDLEAIIFISPGNHDPYTVVSKYAEFNWPNNVKVFREPETVLLDDLGVTITGAGFKNIYERRSLFSQSVDKFNEIIHDLARSNGLAETQLLGNYLHLASFHGEVEANSLYNPISKTDIARSNFSYLALGHIHKGELSLQRAGKTHYAQTGTPEPLDLGDSGVRGVYLLDFAEDMNLRSVQYISTAKTVYIDIFLEFHELGSYEEVLEKLRIEINEQVAIYNSNTRSLSNGLVDKYNFKQDFIFNINIQGTRIEDFNLDNVLLLNLLDESGIIYERVDINLQVSFNIEEIRRENSLRGVFARKILAKIEVADGRDKTVLEEALRLGLRSFTKYR